MFMIFIIGLVLLIIGLVQHRPKLTKYGIIILVADFVLEGIVVGMVLANH